MQCERFLLKPYNPFFQVPVQCERFCIIQVLVPVPVPVPDQASVNTPLKSILEIFIQQDCRTHEYNRAINLYVCTSLFSKMAKISMATPCKQLRMLKRYWKAIVFLFTDKTPNIHVNPSSGVRINPPLNATLQAVHGFGSMYKIYQNYY